MEFTISFQVRNKASVLMFLILFLQIFYFKGRRRSAVIWPISCDLQPVSTRIYENLRLQEDKQAYPTSQSCPYYIKSRNFIGKYYFPVGFQPMNIASLVSKSISKIRGKYRKGKVCLPNYFENTSKKAFGYHFQALTFTLTIIVLRALQR